MTVSKPSRESAFSHRAPRSSARCGGPRFASSAAQAPASGRRHVRPNASLRRLACLRVGKVSVLLALLSCLCVACATGRPRCAQYDPTRSGGEVIPDGEDLAGVVNAVLEAHCTCAFPEWLAGRLAAPQGTPPRSHGDATAAHPQCLGSLKVTHEDFDPDSRSLYLELRPTSFRRRSFAGEYGMVLVNRDGRWLFYWPEEHQPVV